MSTINTQIITTNGNNLGKTVIASISIDTKLSSLYNTIPEYLLITPTSNGLTLIMPLIVSSVGSKVDDSASIGYKCEIRNNSIFTLIISDSSLSSITPLNPGDLVILFSNSVPNNWNFNLVRNVYNIQGTELINTSNGTATLPFIILLTDFIWSSNGGVNTAPFISVTRSLNDIWAPSFNTISNITVTPGGIGIPDSFTCSKYITVLRFTAQIQTSVATTSRWRIKLFVNGINVHSVWAAPPNNIGNIRTFGYLTWGRIDAGSSIYCTIERNTLPASTQNSNSYYEINYEL